MADEEDDASKTEDPSERKLSKAREEGNIPISQEVKSWLVLFACMMFVVMVVPMMMKGMMKLGYTFIATPEQVPFDSNHILFLVKEILKDLILIMLVPFGLFFLTAIAASLIQVGFLYAPKRMSLKWDRLNPFATLKQILSVQKLIETIKGIFKIICVFAAAYLVLKSQIKNIALVSSMEVAGILEILEDILMMLMMSVVLVMMVFAGADYALQKFQHTKKLRMTKQEVKDEYKQMEGDPQIKSRIRAIRMERYRQQMMQQVPNADVVITNPTHYAIALKYDETSMPAPQVVAKGVDYLALRIKEKAKESDVPVIENPELARALYATVELEQFIPEKYFIAVAEILRYVFQLKNRQIKPVEDK